ncbi:hypothetical protein [Streptomyces silvensis]|uniref:Restriction endonuclease type IV Mrr domain-containing protein n=1 Tax=Streptomyces silvensis TaxID=1765722 RepID=A0A0W7X1F1_9ACTN|nr:hypothetical protein [Streptomyces silvensis]KUF16643.1 hypothetical protein AT728_11645 [Streptomyces silvensis]
MAGYDVLVRCPVCRHEQIYAPPAFPCACGAPVVPPVTHGAAVALTHRTPADAWVTVRCATCGRGTDWPRPELGCACGTVLRVPVTSEEGAEGAERAEGAGAGGGAREPDPGDGTCALCAPEGDEGAAPCASCAPKSRPSLTPPHIPLPRTAPTPRYAFRPLPVRGARDAVATCARFLRWLGYEDVREAYPAEERPPSGTRLTALGVLAQIEPTARPASLRDVECAWLTAMTHTVTCACFALSGFTPAARSRADELDVALFRIELSGTPEPLNGAADELTATGA